MAVKAEPDWKGKIPFLAPTCETHRINGVELNFYPVSVNALFKARSMAKPLAAAIRTLFAQNANDRGQVRRIVQGASEEIVQATTPELAKLRAEQDERAISDLVEAFADDKNAMILAELIVDSLRDTFARGSMSAQDSLAWLKDLEAATLTEMLIGLAKGNKRVLGPFGEILSTALERLARQIEGVADVLKHLPVSPTTGSSTLPAGSPSPTA